MPKIHLGIIMDGNRRYARKHQLPKCYEHLQGAYNAINIINHVLQERSQDVKELTLYVLSLDNITKRAPEEIDELMKIMDVFLSYLEKSLDEHKISLNFVGEFKDKLPSKILTKLNRMKNFTIKKEALKINLALCYDGREEIRQASILANKDNTRIEDHLYVRSDIDLVIRTGGNKRTSNFFPWQTIYAEWFFTTKLWPNFTTNDLEKILSNFKGCVRRFGC